MKLTELIEMAKDEDAIITRLHHQCGMYFYSDKKGSPLQILDEQQRYYTSDLGTVYWNPMERDLLANDWYLVRPGKPKGIGANLGNGIVTIPNKNPLPKLEEEK